MSRDLSIEDTGRLANRYKDDPEKLYGLTQFLREQNKQLLQRVEFLEKTLAEQTILLKEIRDGQGGKQDKEKTTGQRNGRKRPKQQNEKSESESESEMQMSDSETPRSSQQKLVNPTMQVEGSADETPVATEIEKTPKVPPIVLKNANDWTAVCNKIRDRKINYNKAKMTGVGLAITPATPNDYRSLAKMLNEDKKEFHTYALPEDKTTRAVIRGLPLNITCEEITIDLANQGVTAASVQRMRNRRSKQPLPLVLVQTTKEQKDKLFQINRCCHLVIRIEPQRQPTGPSQCHRCQQFGHSQGYCTAAPKCVKCGGNHHSAECQKSRDTPAKCANCNGQHPASYRGCARYAAVIQKPAPTKQTPRTAPAAKPAAPARQSGKSFADAAKAGKTNSGAPRQKPVAPPAQPIMDFTAMMQQMQQMYSAMSTFFAQLPPMNKTN